MVVENFRGIEGPREIVFAERGITLIEGPNEAGKSSIAEALRLVRDFKASSQAAEVRSVRPTHVQADPRVEVELRTGPYHLTYAKTFARKGTTELTVHAPSAESLAGEAAHDRASAILAETVDTELWRALHLVQGQPLDQPVLADLEPLHLALAERDHGEGAEVHADLLARVEAEYLRYFTPTGRPTGQYSRLGEELEAARARQEQACEAVAAVARLVERHERLRERRDGLDAELEAQRKEVRSLRERSDELDQLREEHREARQVAAAAEQAAASARATGRRRSELLGEAAASAEALASATADAAAAQAEIAALGDLSGQDPEDAIAAAREAMDAAAEQFDAARVEVEWQRVHERLERAQEAAREVGAAQEALSAHRIDARILQELADAHASWQTAEARSLAAAPQVRVEQLGASVPSVGGEPMQQTNEQFAAVRATVVEVAGSVRVTIEPDQQLADRAHEAQRLREEYERALAHAGASDLEEAREWGVRRTEVERRLETATTQLRAVLDGASEAELAAEAAALRQRRAEHAPALAEAREAYEQAKRAYEQTVRESTRARQERARRVAVAQALRDRLVTAQADVAQASARGERAEAALDVARAESSDGDLAAGLTRAEEAAAAANATVAALDDDLREHGADQLAAELATAEEVLGSTERHDQELAAEIVGVEAQLELLGRDGLQDAANRATEHAADLQRRWASTDARARAARRLHDTLTAHAQRARQRYAAPFREAITELGRTVFGEGFAIDISEDLAISSRTLDGRTVPFASLSGGAREQLGVLARVATARLVNEESGAPVILDDALGYADAQRRQRVMATLHQVAREGTTQIIVLTCEPSRFARLAPDARVRLEP